MRAAGFVAIQALIAAALFGVYLRTGDAAGSYLRAYEDKTELLARTEGPKIVFVGGSNVALGIDSGAIAAALPYRPVNAGLMMGIGSSMMLRQVEPHLRAGDVVLLSPEYDQWVAEFDPAIVFRLLEDNPGAWSDIPPSYVPELLDSSLAYAGQALPSMLGRGGRARTHAPPYDREGFNRFGDFVRHRDLPGKTPLVTPLVVPEVEDGALHDAVTTLNDFQHRAERAGVTILLSFPPLPRDVYESRATDLERLYAYLQDELTIPMLDRPGDMAMPPELFYDTIYHLDRAGVQWRMGHLIERLAEVPDLGPAD